MEQNFFTSAPFVEAVCRSMARSYCPLAIPVVGCGPPRTMYAASAAAPYHSRYVWLAPFWLHASPGWDGALERGTLQAILAFLTGLRTRGFVWTVRFDHAPLVRGLEALGMNREQTSTHVIDLREGYARATSRYSATTRNQIRKALRRGVSVRTASGESDVPAYHALHTRLVRQKEWKGSRYPLALFVELARLRDSVRILLAEHDGRIVSGGVFIRDGCSVLYWHGASDRDYSHLFASRPLFDHAIQWACETGASFVDLGGSAGIASLEQFKASWGAQRETNHVFAWTNPLWLKLSAVKETLSSTRGSATAAQPADRSLARSRTSRSPQ